MWMRELKREREIEMISREDRFGRGLWKERGILYFALLVGMFAENSVF